MLIVNLYERLTPRQIGRYGFMLCTIGLVWLAFVRAQRLERGSGAVGPGPVRYRQGSLVTLLFNVLVTASPKGTGRRRRLVARHHAKSCRRGRNGAGGCAPRRPVELDRAD